jgi:hypothetical protein
MVDRCVELRLKFLFYVLLVVTEVSMKVEISTKKGLKVVELTIKKGIREKCLNCCNWSPKEVKQCDRTNCHLYPYRMAQNPEDTKDRRKAVRRYCLSFCMEDQITEVKLCTCKDCSLYPYRMAKLDRSVEIKKP